MFAKYSHPCFEATLDSQQFRDMLDSASAMGEPILGKRESTSISAETSHAESDGEARPTKKLAPYKSRSEAGEPRGRLQLRRVDAGCPFASLNIRKSISKRTSCDEASKTETDESDQDNFIEQLLKDEFRCQKELLKHFILESLVNQTVNLERLECMPTTCKNQVCVFFKESYGMDIFEDLARGSREAVPVHSSIPDNSSRVSRIRMSLAFRAECYIYGLRKQLCCPQTAAGDQTISQRLFDLTHPGCADQGLRLRFGQLLFDLADETVRVERAEAARILTPELLNKIMQLPATILRKYYQSKLSRHLASLFDHCKSRFDTVDAILSIDRPFGLLDDLLTEQESPRGTSQLVVLGSATLLD